MVNFSFDTSHKNYCALLVLMKKAGVKNLAELCNTALTLLEWVAEEIKKGMVFASGVETEEGVVSYKELKMSWMENVRAK